MNDFKIEFEDIPYNALAEFGITQEMVDDLPEQVLDALTRGHRTPVLPIERLDSNGKKYKDKARISLVESENGIKVMLLPCYEDCALDDYSKEEQEIIRTGKALRVTMLQKEDCYVQLDFATNRLLSAAADLIDQNINVCASCSKFDNNVIHDIKDGEPATITADGGEITLGIDLHTDTGVRIINGSAAEWREVIKNDGLDRYSFGLYGCWVKANNGDLEYVKEEDYTSEMISIESQKVDKLKSSRSLKM